MPMPIAIPGPAWFRFAAATARWITIAHRMAPRAVGKATMKPSPWVLTTAPPNALIRLRTIAPCSRTIREASSSPNSSVCSVYRRTARTLRVRSGDCFLRPARSRSSPAALQGGTKNSSRCTGEMERLSNRLPSLSPNDAARLQLVARQAAKRHRRHLEPDAEARPQRLLQSRRARRVPDLDQHADLVKLPRPEDLDLELIDRRETPHDPLDRGREHVDATDDEHVVEAPEDAALQAAEGVRPHGQGASARRTWSPVRYRTTGEPTRPRFVRTSSPSRAGAAVAGSITSTMNSDSLTWSPACWVHS